MIPQIPESNVGIPHFTPSFQSQTHPTSRILDYKSRYHKHPDPWVNISAQEQRRHLWNETSQDTSEMKHLNNLLVTIPTSMNKSTVKHIKKKKVSDDQK